MESALQRPLLAILVIGKLPVFSYCYANPRSPLIMSDTLKYKTTHTRKPLLHNGADGRMREGV